MAIGGWTIALQTVNFLVLVWLMTRFLYRPVKEVIARRQALVGEAVKLAEDKAAAAEASRAKYESDRSDFRAERQKLLAQTHDQLQTERQAYLDATKAQAAELLAAANKSIAEERAKALTGLKKQIADLAGEMSAKLLSEAPLHDAGPAGYKQADDYFHQQSADQIAALRAGVTDAQVPVTVVTAEPMSDDETRKWDAGLHGFFGAGVDVSFVTDAQILGGAEIRFPHATLSFSLAGKLREISDALLDEPNDD